MEGRDLYRPGSPSPKISVIMAVHNGEEYLREAIKSIVGQTFDDFELIVVDDGSTDKSTEIIRASADRRLRFIPLERNVGLANALNCGISAARGELIARMDSDDVALPGRFQAQFERMKSEPGLVLLGSSFNYIDTDGCILKNQPMKTDDATIRHKLFNDCNQFCHPSVMMRRDAVLIAGGYRTLAGRYAQDYDLWLRLAEVGSIANLPDAYLGYRVHKGQSSVNKLYAQRRAAELYKILARQRRESGFEDFSAAENEAAGRCLSLKKSVATDFLFWSELFACMGDRTQSFRMQGRALWLAPFSRAVHAAIRKHVLSALRGGESPN